MAVSKMSGVICPCCKNELTAEELKSIMRAAAAIGGSRTSEAKKKSSAENGKKGGRPRKIK